MDFRQISLKISMGIFLYNSFCKTYQIIDVFVFALGLAFCRFSLGGPSLLFSFSLPPRFQGLAWNKILKKQEAKANPWICVKNQWKYPWEFSFTIPFVKPIKIIDLSLPWGWLFADFHWVVPLSLSLIPCLQISRGSPETKILKYVRRKKQNAPMSFHSSCQSPTS